MFLQITLGRDIIYREIFWVEKTLVEVKIIQRRRTTKTFESTFFATAGRLVVIAILVL